jgi:hypothetical protein
MQGEDDRSAVLAGRQPGDPQPFGDGGFGASVPVGTGVRATGGLEQGTGHRSRGHPSASDARMSGTSRPGSSPTFPGLFLTSPTKSNALRRLQAMPWILDPASRARGHTPIPSRMSGSRRPPGEISGARETKRLAGLRRHRARSRRQPRRPRRDRSGLCEGGPRQTGAGKNPRRGPESWRLGRHGAGKSIPVPSLDRASSRFPSMRPFLRACRDCA